MGGSVAVVPGGPVGGVANEEIKDDGSRHNGHDGALIHVEDSKSYSIFFEAGHDPISGGQPVGGSAGEGDGVDALHRVVWR